MKRNGGIMLVIKRDGKEVQFNFKKIEKAVAKAFKETFFQETPKEVLDKIREILPPESSNTSLSVETIQDIIESVLIATNNWTVAKAYTTYRYKRQLVRESKAKLMNAFSSKLMAKAIENQNANVDEASFGGRIGEATRVMTKDWALNHCMSKMARENHLNNEIYIHDLDSYAVGMHNCLSIPFDDLLAKGFNTRQTDVRPANSINTAFQLVAVIFQLQSLQQFGGVSATHLDWTMVPYVRKSFAKHYAECMNIRQDSKYQEWKPEFCNENGKIPLEEISIDNSDIYQDEAAARWAMKLTEKELKQAVEGFYHNLGTLQSRSGNQLPFSSINYGTCSLPEGRMVIEALLEGSINGVGKFHKTPIFPCGIFQYMKGVNDKPGTPNYDLYLLALKSTSLRLYPNYANVDWSGNAGYDKDNPKTYFSTMGCRTANGWDINGFGQLKDGRGNICPVTIILPTLAMEANRDVETFMDLLDKKIGEAKDMLIERFNWICSQNPNSAKFMYENGTMAGYVPEEGIISALKHGTLAIGQIALAETLQLLIGEDQTTEKGMGLAKRIEQLFKDRCAEFKEKYKLNFGVYYTPAENLCYTSMKKFKEKYGIIPQVSDKEFFTNSIHVPVWHKCNPFEKIDIESQLTGYSSAGCITYVELPSTTKNNIEGLQTIVDYAMSKDIPYFAVNVPNDTCNNCGYQDEIGNNCPQCGSGDIARLRRVTGYLTGDYKTAFNVGKQDEVERRVKHIK